MEHLPDAGDLASSGVSTARTQCRRPNRRVSRCWARTSRALNWETCALRYNFPRFRTIFIISRYNGTGTPFLNVVADHS
jgi:hypothetical protein